MGCMSLVTVCLDEPLARIHPNLYGHFIEHLGHCVDGGIWVGDCDIPNIQGIRADVVAALKKIRPSVLRWPGGCYADTYHWRDGIGPRESRPRTVNLWWGQTVEDNQFGTHEFIQLCRLIGAEPYFGGNVGSGTPREMSDWVEYCNYPGDSTLARERAANGSAEPLGVRYWGVGNEAWGCGGKFCPEDYAAEYKRYANFLHDLGGTPLQLIAVGPNSNDLDWSERFFKKLGSFRRVHGFAAHYYVWNGDARYGTATEFTREQYYGMLHKGLGVEQMLVEQRQLLDRFDPQRQIGLILDEWGMWHPPTAGQNPKFLWQQNTMRDALAAAMSLDVFHRHADKLVMANIAQMVNVLQALLLSEGEKLITTPTYHIFDLYQGHQGGQAMRIDCAAPAISFSLGEVQGSVPRLSGSASVKNNTLTLSLVHSHDSEPLDATLQLRGGTFGELQVAELLAEEVHAYNTFAAPNRVKPRRSVLRLSGEQWHYTFSPASVTVFTAPLGGR
jgi:alpha-N-arabinofuranosidase